MKRKILTPLIALLSAAPFVCAQDLGAERTQARQVAANNGVHDAGSNSIPVQLAAIFRWRQNTEALWQKAQAWAAAIAPAVATADPSQAAAIAAAISTTVTVQSSDMSNAVRSISRAAFSDYQHGRYHATSHQC